MSSHLLHATLSHAAQRLGENALLHASHQHPEQRLESCSLHALIYKSKRSSEVITEKRRYCG
jgi:hypothetical protein